MTPQEIQKFRNAVNHVYCEANYGRFCSALGWPEDGYSEEKWRRFSQLVDGLAPWSNETLSQLLNAF